MFPSLKSSLESSSATDSALSSPRFSTVSVTIRHSSTPTYFGTAIDTVSCSVRYSSTTVSDSLHSPHSPSAGRSLVRYSL